MHAMPKRHRVKKTKQTKRYSSRPVRVSVSNSRYFPARRRWWWSPVTTTLISPDWHDFPGEKKQPQPNKFPSCCVVDLYYIRCIADHQPIKESVRAGRCKGKNLGHSSLEHRCFIRVQQASLLSSFHSGSHTLTAFTSLVLQLLLLLPPVCVNSSWTVLDCALCLYVLLCVTVVCVCVCSPRSSSHFHAQLKVGSVNKMNHVTGIAYTLIRTVADACIR